MRAVSGRISWRSLIPVPGVIIVITPSCRNGKLPASMINMSRFFHNAEQTWSGLNTALDFWHIFYKIFPFLALLALDPGCSEAEDVRCDCW